ncbi:MAG: hypothetical protein AAFY76_09665, partial [Cyanobacteria bacterium J06649_11]
IVENEEQFMKTIQKLRRVDYDTPISLYGAEKYQFRMFDLTEGTLSYRRRWIFNDVDKSIITHEIVPKTKESCIMVEYARTFLYMSNKLFVAQNSHQFPSWINFTRPEDCNLECRNVYGKSLEVFVAFKRRLQRIKKVKRDFFKTLTRRYNQLSFRILEGAVGHTFELFSSDHPIFKDIFRGNKCPNPTCLPGLHKDFGESQGITWNRSLGWRCIPCPVNSVKPLKGDGQCVPCSTFFISNKDHTKCYDPYTKVFVKLQWTSVKLCIATSSLLFFFSLFTIFVFARNKQTWIVQSSDLKISTAHLALLMVNFILPNISFFVDSNWLYWTVYLLTISLVNCCCLSIVLVKSKKLLQAFNSKVRVNRSETLRTAYHQISIVILNMILATVLFIFSIEMRGLKETSVRFSSTLESVVYCEHDLHIILQMMFLMCLQIACFIPAYQGRNLPSVFNNAMAIVYGCFVMVVCSLVFLPVYLFQNDPRHKYIVEHLTFQCLGLIQVSFLYWPKVYVLLFHPKKKSKLYLRQKTFSFTSVSSR